MTEVLCDWCNDVIVGEKGIKRQIGSRVWDLHTACHSEARHDVGHGSRSAEMMVALNACLIALGRSERCQLELQDGQYAVVNGGEFEVHWVPQEDRDNDDHEGWSEYRGKWDFRVYHVTCQRLMDDVDVDVRELFCTTDPMLCAALVVKTLTEERLYDVYDRDITPTEQRWSSDLE